MMTGAVVSVADDRFSWERLRQRFSGEVRSIGCQESCYDCCSAQRFGEYTQWLNK